MLSSPILDSRDSNLSIPDHCFIDLSNVLKEAPQHALCSSATVPIAIVVNRSGPVTQTATDSGSQECEMGKTESSVV